MTHLTLEDYLTAESNGIGRRTLEMRVRKLGMDKDMAIKAPVNKIRREWLPIALENDIKARTFDYRYYDAGWDPEVAATKPVREGVMHG